MTHDRIINVLSRLIYWCASKQDPEEEEAWTGVRNASSQPEQCLQISFTNLKSGVISEEHVFGSEDCLYLNVFTPELQARRATRVCVRLGEGKRSQWEQEVNDVLFCRWPWLRGYLWWCTYMGVGTWLVLPISTSLTCCSIIRWSWSCLSSGSGR